MLDHGLVFHSFFHSCGKLRGLTHCRDARFPPLTGVAGLDSSGLRAARRGDHDSNTDGPGKEAAQPSLASHTTPNAPFDTRLTAV